MTPWTVNNLSCMAKKPSPDSALVLRGVRQRMTASGAERGEDVRGGMHPVRAEERIGQDGQTKRPPSTLQRY